MSVGAQDLRTTKNSLAGSDTAKWRSQLVVYKRKEASAQAAVAAAEQAEAVARTLSAAMFLSRILGARHANSADMQLLRMRQAGRLLFQRTSEASLYRGFISSSATASAAVSVHCGPAMLRRHLASTWLCTRLGRRQPRKMLVAARASALCLQAAAARAVHQNQHRLVRGLCCYMVMAPWRKQHEQSRKAASHLQTWLRLAASRRRLECMLDATQVVQAMMLRALGMLSYPRWSAVVAIRCHMLARVKREHYVSFIAARLQIARVLRMQSPRMVLLRLDACLHLCNIAGRLYPAMLARRAFSARLTAGHELAAAARNATTRRKHAVACSAGSQIAAFLACKSAEREYAVAQVLEAVVGRAWRDAAITVVRARNRAATVLQATLIRLIARLAMDKLHWSRQHAAARMQCHLRACQLSTARGFRLQRSAAKLLQRRLRCTLNAVAEAGVRYFVHFLWRRIHRAMLLSRLQRTVRAILVRRRFASMHTATVLVQARLKTRKGRGEYILLTRGWRRRPELEDAKWDRRRKGEDDDAYAQRIEECRRERAWLERSLQEEAVEDSLDLSTGEIIRSRALSRQEYSAYLGLAPSPLPVAPAPLASEMRLVIEVVAGKGLKAMDSNGFSDPYVTFQVGDGTQPGKCAQTRVVQKCLDPQWLETLEVLVSPREMEDQLLHVRVFDKDLIPGADDLIGGFSTPLSQIVRDLEGSERDEEQHAVLHKRAGAAQWYTLYDKGKTETGAVKVSYRLAPMMQARALAVDVVAARNLKAMDTGGNFLTGYSASSDPYVTLTIGSHPDVATKQCRTSVVNKNLNPEWHEHFQLLPSALDVETEALVITVWDKDFVRDDVIGRLSLPLAQIAHRDNLYDVATLEAGRQELHANSWPDDEPEWQWHHICDESGVSTGEIQLGAVLTAVTVAKPMLLTVKVMAGKELKVSPSPRLSMR